VAGSGAIGSVFGGFLRRAGYPVTLLGRAWHLEFIRAKGLAIDGIWGEHQVHGFEVAVRPDELRGPFDLVLVTVKAYDTETMGRVLAPLVHPSGLVLSLQNGLGNVEALAATYGAGRSLGASVLVGATIPAAGWVTVTVQAAPVIIGPLAATPSAMERAGRWAERIVAAGISCEATDRIQAVLWSKVFYNGALNPLGALLDVHYGALGDDPELRALMDQLIEEAYQVARAEGVPLPWASADAYRELFYASLLPSTYNHRSSMLQDLERGRRTEIEAINGQVVARGRRLGIPTPTHEVLTRMIRARERLPRNLSFERGDPKKQES
jgi:2-dehydropantoate 2-reductase